MSSLSVSEILAADLLAESYVEWSSKRVPKSEALVVAIRYLHGDEVPYTAKRLFSQMVRDAMFRNDMT